MLCTAGDSLRWDGITVEDEISKYDFLADLTIRDGRLIVNRFQLNTFALGVKLLSARDATDYLNEYMEEGNDWHIGYTILKTYSDKFHPSNAIHKITKRPTTLLSPKINWPLIPKHNHIQPMRNGDWKCGICTNVNFAFLQKSSSQYSIYLALIAATSSIASHFIIQNVQMCIHNIQHHIVTHSIM
jgi:hypothetical protein